MPKFEQKLVIVSRATTQQADVKKLKPPAKNSAWMLPTVWFIDELYFV